ncbi:hypothetical protein U1Q18_005363 [Sarracenia purpurea var. burkii]
MSLAVLGVEEGDVISLASSASTDSICQNTSELTERNYMGLSDCSSVDSSTISTTSEDNSCSLNLKATELRLGLPGSQSPERDLQLCLLNSSELDEKPLFSLHPVKANNYSISPKTVVSGNKRGFSDAMDGFSEGRFNAMLSPRATSNLSVKSGTVKDNPGTQPSKMKEVMPKHASQSQERTSLSNENDPNCTGALNDIISPSDTKAQVVGWPPIRSYRKNTLTTTSKNTDEAKGKAGSGSLFVKVGMAGAPYLRKVDLRTYSAYQELSSALEKMFRCFIMGQYGSHGAPGREMLSDSKLVDLLHGSVYVLAYEDKDGDWMLVGDVPWQMFIDTCKRLRIMKSSDAIGLGVFTW